MSDLKVKVFNAAGSEIGEESLNPNIFAVAVKDDLVHQATVAHFANTRQVLAHTKQRGEVRGGGRKPWKQKGTGRARHGSNRSPLWIGGAVTFGPRSNRNFSKKLNKKMKRKALFMALSDKVAHDKTIVIDSFDMKDAKTKSVKNMRNALSLQDASILFVYAKEGQAVSKSVRNIPNAYALDANSLNIAQVLKHEYIVVEKDALSVIEQTYLA